MISLLFISSMNTFDQIKKQLKSVIRSNGTTAIKCFF